MPVSEAIAAHAEAVREFLDGRDAGPFYLRVASEVELLAAKIVATLQDAACGDELFFAHSSVFNDPSSYYAGAAQAVRDNVAAHRDELFALGVALPPASVFEATLFDRADITPELAFAEFAERTARELSAVCQGVVFVLHAEHDSDHAAFVASTAQVGTVSGMGCAQLIVLASSACAIPSELPAAQRIHVSEPTAEVLTPALEFLTTYERRVLVLRASREALQSRERARAWTEVRARLPWMDFIELEIPPHGSSMHAAVAALAAESQRRGLDLPLRSELCDAAIFADLCERLVRTLPGRQRALCVVLSARCRTRAASTEFGAFALELASTAASPVVRYIVVDESDSAIMPPLLEAPRRLPQREIGLDAGTIEAGMRKALASLQLPLSERIQYLGACASLHLSRGELDDALGLREEQLALCERAGDPSHELIAWLGIGDAFYARKRWPEAEAAYSNMLNLALDQEHDAMIAQAMLSLGHTQLRATRLDEAIDSYQSAQQWYELSGHTLWSCCAGTWLGEAHRRAGTLDAADEIWRDTLNRYRTLPPELNGEVGVAELRERLARLDSQRRVSTQTTDRLEQPAFVPEEP